MDDLYSNATFAVKDVPGFNVMNDGVTFTKTEIVPGGAQVINKYNLKDASLIATLFDNSLQKFNNTSLYIDKYEFSADEHKLLLYTEGQNIYRRSVLYQVYVYDIDTKNITPVDDEKILHASFNPQGDKVAFVKHNNIYLKDLHSGNTHQLTTDGEQNKIINGNCDWVYEEEFEFTQAYQWSPDGNFIAFYRFDESRVKEYTIPFYDNIYPTLYTYKYPKAGEDNSIVSIHFYQVNSGTVTLADIGSETDQYIPRIKWANNNQLCIYRLNRLQNKLELLITTASTGNSAVALTEENKYFIKIDDNLTFLHNGDAFIFTSERSGFNHLYSYNLKTQSLLQLTNGNWSVDELIAVDEKNNSVYFTCGETSPLVRKLYCYNWKKNKSVCLTPLPGWHDITPCEGLHYFLDRYSSIHSVPVYTLIDNKGKPIRVLEDNAALQHTMAEYNLGNIRLLTLPGDSNVSLNAWMITPPDFDSSKKYPVLMYQYSGPGSQEVKDYFPLDNYFWHQMMAQKGYIIVCADGTGTGFRGEAFEKKTYLQLGNLESNDQIAVAGYLAKQTFVNAKRIGIWGWSFGGFMSSTCILKGANVFAAAVAVAPVTNWRYYDNIYTERYMRTPKENAAGYDNNAPEKMAKNLKGKLLLIHGTGDDNVHFQNSVALTQNLIDADKQFESEYYPNKNHGISGGITRRQLFERITDFLEKNL